MALTASISVLSSFKYVQKLTKKDYNNSMDPIKGELKSARTNDVIIGVALHAKNAGFEIAELPGR